MDCQSRCVLEVASLLSVPLKIRGKIYELTKSVCSGVSPPAVSSTERLEARNINLQNLCVLELTPLLSVPLRD